MDNELGETLKSGGRKVNKVATNEEMIRESWCGPCIY